MCAVGVVRAGFGHVVCSENLSTLTSRGWPCFLFMHRCIRLINGEQQEMSSLGTDAGQISILCWWYRLRQNFLMCRQSSECIVSQRCKLSISPWWCRVFRRSDRGVTVTEIDCFTNAGCFRGIGSNRTFRMQHSCSTPSAATLIRRTAGKHVVAKPTTMQTNAAAADAGWALDQRGDLPCDGWGRRDRRCTLLFDQ